MSETDFAERIQQAIEHSVVDMIQKGNWIQPNYATRIVLDLDDLKQVYRSIDMQKVITLVQGDVERRIADVIFHSLASTIDRDVKKILGDQELREDIRGIIQGKIEEVHSALYQENS